MIKYVKIRKMKRSDDMFNKLYDNCFKSELTTKVVKVEEDRGMYWHACKDTIFFLGNEDMEQLTREIIHFIEAEAHTSGLTNKIKNKLYLASQKQKHDNFVIYGCY